MEKDLKRGTRRARTEAKKQTRMRLGYHGHTLWPSRWYETPYAPADAGKLRESPQVCSCRSCGNQRAHLGDKPKDRAHALLTEIEIQHGSSD